MVRHDVLVRRVRQAMLHDGRRSSQSIEVTAPDGRVTRQRMVQTFSRKLAAGEIASAIEGVRRVRGALGDALVRFGRLGRLWRQEFRRSTEASEGELNRDPVARRVHVSGAMTGAPHSGQTFDSSL